jgi:D-alanine-D-alanine ligase-like ATP-grasp enzyme
LGSEDYKNYQKVITQSDEIHSTLMKKMNKLLKIQDYSKADFIEKDGIYYLIDVSPNPTLTKSSAFTEQFLFNSKKMEDLIPELLKGVNI